MAWRLRISAIGGFFKLLIGPILGVITAMALKLTTAATVQIVIASVFLVVVLIVVESQIGTGQRQNADFYEEVTNLFKNYFPARVLKDRTTIYAEHARQLEATKKVLCVFGTGADISNQVWDERTQPYRDGTHRALERGVQVYRVQVLPASPLSWLRYLAQLMTAHGNQEKFRLRFTEELRSDLFQFVISDETEMHMLLRIRDAPEPQEISIHLTDKEAVKSLQAYFYKTLWARSFAWSATQLESFIKEEEVRRTKAMRELLGELMIHSLHSGTKQLRVSEDDLFEIARDRKLVELIVQDVLGQWEQAVVKGNLTEAVSVVQEWVGAKAQAIRMLPAST